MFWTNTGWNIDAIVDALAFSAPKRLHGRIRSIVETVVQNIPFPPASVVRVRGEKKRYVIASVQDKHVMLIPLAGGAQTYSNINVSRLVLDVDQRVIFEGPNARKLRGQYEYMLSAEGNEHLARGLGPAPSRAQEALEKDAARAARVDALLDQPVSAARLRAAAIQREVDAQKALRQGSESYEDITRRQSILRALADASDAGEVLPWSTVAAVIHAIFQHDSRVTEILERFTPQAGPSLHDVQQARRLQELEASVGTVEGYFPTPPSLVREVIERAAIHPGSRVLEPSAGRGDLALAARNAGATVDTVEKNQRLQEILALRGFRVIGNDCMELPMTPAYDVVVMNPPFERGQDAVHVMQMYQLLKPGGKLVAIMSEGPFFRGDKKSTVFRAWLESVHGWSESREAAFKTALRSTGVRVRVVEVEKPR